MCVCLPPFGGKKDKFINILCCYCEFSKVIFVGKYEKLNGGVPSSSTSQFDGGKKVMRQAKERWKKQSQSKLGFCFVSALLLTIIYHKVMGVLVKKT